MRQKTKGGWILAATILGSSMAFIDGTVVNVALPALQEIVATVHAGSRRDHDAASRQVHRDDGPRRGRRCREEQQSESRGNQARRKL